MSVSKTVTVMLLQTPLARRRGDVIHWFISKGALSSASSIPISLRDLPMAEEYRQTFWTLIDRNVISEVKGVNARYYLNEAILPKTIRKREWVLLDLSAAILLIASIWLAYLFLPFLPFFG